jgi:hypothetical protein
MFRKALLFSAAAALTLAATSAGASVVTNIYSGHTLTGGGAPYSGFVGSLVTPGISFATDTGYNWHPFGLGDFGADSTGSLNVATSGTYTFHLSSDDGALVFVDGSLLIDRGGPHGPSTTDGTLFLTAGLHSYEVQFFECCGGPSGLDFSIPLGTTIGTVPEPATWALMLLGFGAAGYGLRRQRKLALAA